MSLPHHSERDWLMITSGIIWIPYCLVMLVCFIEQFRFRRYPQYLIMLCLWLDCCCRCIWFLGYTKYHTTISMIYVNRIAILFQFTALSLLVLMWSRVLRVSARTMSSQSSVSDKIEVERLSSRSPPPVFQSATALSLLPETLSRQEVQHKELQDSFNLYFWIMAGVNVLVWAFVLVSIGLSFTVDNDLYNINILAVAILCFVEGMLILVVGIRTGLRISRDLSPVFLSWRATANPVQKSRCTKMRELFSELYLVVFQPSNRSTRLHAQAEAVRKLVFVSSIIAFFFLIRSLCFLYILYVSPYINSAGMDSFINVYGYPCLFYQVPELVPNLAIAIGISPSNGYLRRFWVFMFDKLSSCLSFENCCSSSSRKKSVNHNRRTMSVTRPSSGLFSWRVSSSTVGQPQNQDRDSEFEDSFEDDAHSPVHSSSPGSLAATSPASKSFAFSDPQNRTDSAETGTRTDSRGYDSFASSAYEGEGDEEDARGSKTVEMRPSFTGLHSASN